MINSKKKKKKLKNIKISQWKYRIDADNGSWKRQKDGHTDNIDNEEWRYSGV